MNNLPNDILSYIFKYIPQFTPFIRATNKRFNQIILNSDFDLKITVDVIVYDDYTPEQYPGLVRAVDEICLKYGYYRKDLKAHSSRGYVVAIKE